MVFVDMGHGDLKSEAKYVWTLNARLPDGFMEGDACMTDIVHQTQPGKAP